MQIKMRAGEIVINGKSFKGSSITVNGDEVIVDGLSLSVEPSPEYVVTINGYVDEFALKSGTVKADNVGMISTSSGNVNCADIAGDVRTGSGDVKAGVVSGSVSTGSGDVHCKAISGSVRTGSGDIYQ